MHPNPLYRQTTSDNNFAFALQRGFGVLMVNGPNGPLAAHIPFVVSSDGQNVEAHLVRSNPLARALASPQPALLAVSGPDGYISPDWYGVEDQVPTWNYVAVHLRGDLSLRPQDQLREHLDRLADRFEAALLPKPIWKTTKMTPEVLDRMMRQIVPVAFRIHEVHGTWKLNQNKTPEARLGAADGVAAHGPGQEHAALAALMRGVVQE